MRWGPISGSCTRRSGIRSTDRRGKPREKADTSPQGGRRISKRQAAKSCAEVRPYRVVYRQEGNPGRNGLPGEGQSLREWPGGQAPQYSTDRRAAPEKGGHLPPITRLAAVKRGVGPFATGQTPAQSHCAWDVIPAPPFIQPRPPPRPRASFLFWTVHGPFACGLRAAASRRLASGTRLRAQSRFLLARKNWGPRAACRGGRGGRNGAERSPRR